MAGEKIKYRDRFYAVDVPLPADRVTGILAAGTAQTASVTVQNFPFLLKRVGHAIVGPNMLVNVGIVTHADVSQDGQYRIRVRANEKNFMNVPIQALAGFGGGQFSQPIDLEAPIEFAPNDTIAVDVVNDVQRLAGISIQIVFEGVEPYEA